MTAVRLNRELYDAPAVEEAVKTFERFGSIERKDDASHWVVNVSCPTSARELQISRELSNFALGLTVRGAKQS